MYLLDNLHGFPGLQEEASERPRHQPQRLHLQPGRLCGRYAGVEETEDYQTAGEMDGGELQVSIPLYSVGAILFFTFALARLDYVLI